MLTRGAHHASLVVGDTARSKRFYGDLLGLEEIDRPDFGIPGAWYRAGPIQLHLVEPPPGVDSGSPPAEFTLLAAHLAFEIEDCDAVADALESEGVEVKGRGSPSGQLFARDPDGNLIEFIRPGGRLGRAEDDPAVFSGSSSKGLSSPEK